MRSTLWRVFGLALMFASPAWASPSIPDPLRTWSDWAAEPYAFRECALSPGTSGQATTDYVCAWPGKLALVLTDRDGHFQQGWTMGQAGVVFLPGSTEAWPQQVQVDGKRAAVVATQGRPSIALAKGTHQVSGQWNWEQLPSSLMVPGQTAWWEATINGKPKFVRRDGEALLFETKAPVVAVAKNSLTVRVFAKWLDGQVPQEDILVQMTVGGAPREVVLGPITDPKRMAPLGIDSAWAAKWEDDGRVRVQVQPGSNQLHIQLRCIARCNEPFAKAKAPEPWPAVEFWALQSDPAFRVVAWNGQGVDPRQIGAPEEWAQLPWISVANGASGSWSVKARGPSDKDAALALQRMGWLDFDGSGWWLVDTISGKTPRSGRIEALPPYQMQAARWGGEPVLVSTHQGGTGVEVRAAEGSLQAVLRQAGAAPRLPIAGEKGEFSSVSWNLHLPAGYQVLFAPGADTASNVWWNRWRLTQVLSVALILLLSWRWGGWRAALPAGALLLLSFHVPGFPRWSWGFALALALLSQAGLPGKLGRVVGIVWKMMLVLWLLLAAGFAIDQVRGALYPEWAVNQSRSVFGQLPMDGNTRAMQGEAASMEEGTYRKVATDAVAPAAPSVNSMAENAPSAELARKEMEQKQIAMVAAAPSPMEAGALADRPAELVQHNNIAPPSVPQVPLVDVGTKIAAGPGLPSWQSAEPVSLAWQGPITSKDTVKLWIASPALVILGRWLSVVLLALVGWTLWKRQTPGSLNFKFGARKTLAASLFLLASQAHAAPAVGVEGVNIQTPATAIMERLGAQLRPIPKCAPACVGISNARLSTQGSQLHVSLEVHAQAHAAVALPGATDQTLVLISVHQDGKALPAVMQQGQDAWIEVEAGVSQADLVFEARGESGALRFGQTPGRVELLDSHWTLTGVERGLLPSGVLGWQRTLAKQTTHKDEDTGQEAFAAAPFVRISRTLVLGPKWELHTQVDRLAPQRGAFVVPVKLIENEKVRTDMPRDKQGNLLVSFQEGQGSVDWVSDLPSQSQLTLVAPNSTQAIEQWMVQAGPRFHVEAQGMVPRADNTWAFQALPGEKLTLHISEPKAVDGALVAVDQVQVMQQWGPRGQTISLSLTTRATTATDLTLGVPKALELVSIQQNGAPVPGVKIEGGKLALAVPPGSVAWQVEFRASQAPAPSVSTPQFSLNAPIANLTLTHVPGAKRWVLATFGPGKGPAVAYWPWLIVLMGLAWFAGRWRKSPLTTWQWVLLGLGFSIAAPWKIAIVGGWLIAMHLRQLKSEQLHESPLFNLAQLGLLAWSLLAVMVLVAALPEGLLASPDMRIMGAQGGALPWFVDQVKQGQVWPEATVISLPIGVYRALMLAWALWLALSAINWLRDALRAWLSGGHWHGRVKAPKADEPPPPMLDVPSGD